MEHRKRYTPTEKVSILRQHFIEREKVLDICKEHKITSSMFYQWRKRFFDNGHKAFIKEKTYVNSLEPFKDFIINLMRNGFSTCEIYNELKQKEL